MSNKSYGYMELNGFIGEEKINEFYFLYFQVIIIIISTYNKTGHRIKK